MRAVIPPSHYVSDQAFSREQDQLFSRAWQFVAMAEELAQPNDFVALTLGGKSVVVQNFDGELRAFQNVCRHRHSILQCERRGNRPLVCPYHGWRYDKTGLASGIPSRPRFDEADLRDSESLRLDAYAVEACGKFVFVRPSSKGVSLGEFLGATAPLLQKISAGMGHRVDTLELTEAANWKVAVENTLEFYHVNLIHRDSFAKLGASEREQLVQGPHSQAMASVAVDPSARRASLMEMLSARPFSIEGYLHQFIFPNLTIATTQGATFSVQTFEPVAAGTTRFTSHVYATLTGKPAGATVAAAIAQQTAEFNRKVFSEDQAVCELVQRGLRETPDERRGMLSSEEGRVQAFQHGYLEWMENGK